jgi:hypothetical protein
MSLAPTYHVDAIAVNHSRKCSGDPTPIFRSSKFDLPSPPPKLRRGSSRARPKLRPALSVATEPFPLGVVEEL